MATATSTALQDLVLDADYAGTLQRSGKIPRHTALAALLNVHQPCSTQVFENTFCRQAGTYSIAEPAIRDQVFNFPLLARVNYPVGSVELVLCYRSL
jgi:hypothetical protein